MIKAKSRIRFAKGHPKRMTLKDFRNFARGLPPDAELHIENRANSVVLKLYYNHQLNEIVIGR